MAFEWLNCQKKRDFWVFRSAIQRRTANRLPFTSVLDRFYPALTVDILRIISCLVIRCRTMASHGLNMNAIEDRRKMLRRS